MRFIPVRIATGQSNYKPLGVSRFCAWVEEKNEICPGSFCFMGFKWQKGDLSRFKGSKNEIYPGFRGRKVRFIQVQKGDLSRLRQRKMRFIRVQKAWEK